jgi:segregation and condensation protein B
LSQKNNEQENFFMNKDVIDNESTIEEESTNETNAAGSSETAETSDLAESGGVTHEQIVEAVLFSSDTPLPMSKIASVLGIISAREIRLIIETLNHKYAEMNASFRIEEIAGGVQMMTKPDYAPYLQQLYKVRSEGKLSAAALETLAVVSYKQPVVRAEVESIRGVACGEMIRALMEKGLIKIVGRSEELGRPMLYGTTKKFLEVFGLASLEDLPKVPDLLPPSRIASHASTPREQPASEHQAEQPPSDSSSE